MNWIINGKYVLSRTTQTQLEKSALFTKCKIIKRSDLKKFSKYIGEEKMKNINFIARISEDGKIDVDKPMYFVEF